MVLWMIGLGLGDEGDISVKGLKAVQQSLGSEHFTQLWRECLEDLTRHAGGCKRHIGFMGRRNILLPQQGVHTFTWKRGWTAHGTGPSASTPAIDLCKRRPDRVFECCQGAWIRNTFKLSSLDPLVCHSSAFNAPGECMLYILRWCWKVHVNSPWARQRDIGCCVTRWWKAQGDIPKVIESSLKFKNSAAVRVWFQWHSLTYWCECEWSNLC